MSVGGIIAAGEGSRLRADGYAMSKPMLPLRGKPLIAHTLDRFRSARINRVTIIINEESDDLRHWLRSHARDVDLIVRTTPSSYASFRIVAERLAPAPAIVTTVDAILSDDDFRRFAREAEGFGDDAVVLGVTSYVDDEKPLWATLDAKGRVVKLGGASGSHVTAGLYRLPEGGLPAPPSDFARLRDYLGWLADRGDPVYGVALPLVFDIDRAHDVEAAEAALGLQHENAR